MKTIYNNINLSSIVKKEIAKKYPKQYSDYVKYVVKEEYIAKFVTNWKYILLLILTVFIAFIVGFYVIGVCCKIGATWNFLSENKANIKVIDIEKIATLLKDRLANVATFIGVSLTVSTMLINNLDKKKENYDILIRKFYLLPVVYSVLSIVAYYLVCLACKDLVCIHWFAEIAIVGHYLAIVALMLIGYLFSKILDVFDKTKMESYYLAYSLLSAKRAIYIAIFKKIEFDIIKENTTLYDETKSKNKEPANVDKFLDDATFSDEFGRRLLKGVADNNKNEVEVITKHYQELHEIYIAIFNKPKENK